MAPNYDYRGKIQINLNSKNDARTLFVEQIKENSSVLEFGCAYGIMTRYLKEKKNCNISICEIDPEGFNATMEFAIDGFCGDIETLGFLETFKGRTFDYITFGDVLEHLRNPQAVLRAVGILLNEDGRILISVPNIAHSAVIIDLMNNKFNYTELGILDNTHYHHFTYNSLIQIIHSSGLIPILEEATYTVPKNTLDFKCDYSDVPIEIESYLSCKKFGTVFQFVITCVKMNWYRHHGDDIPQKKLIRDLRPHNELKLYFEQNGIIDDQNVCIRDLYIGRNHIKLDLSKWKSCRLRMDFGWRACTVRLMSVLLNGVSIKTSSYVGNFDGKIDDHYYFNHTDPYIWLDNSELINTIELTLEYHPTVPERILYAARKAKALMEKQQIDKEENESLKRSISNLEDRLGGLYKLYTDSIESKDKTISELNRKLLSVQNESNLNMKCKDKTISELNQKLLLVQNENRLNTEHKDSIIYAQTQNLLSVKELYNSTINSTCWKITKPIRWFINTIRRK